MNELKNTPLNTITPKEIKTKFLEQEMLDVEIRSTSSTTPPIIQDPKNSQASRSQTQDDSDIGEIKISSAIQNPENIQLNQLNIKQGINLSIVLAHQNQRYPSISIDDGIIVPTSQVNPFIEISNGEAKLSYAPGEKPKTIVVDYSKISVDNSIPTAQGIKSGVSAKDESAQMELGNLLNDENISVPNVNFKDKIDRDKKDFESALLRSSGLAGAVLTTEKLQDKIDTKIAESKYKEKKGTLSLDKFLFKKKEITLQERFKPNEDSQTLIDEFVCQLARLWYLLMQWLEKMLKKFRKWLFNDISSFFHTLLGKKQKEKDSEEAEEKLELERIRRKLEKERKSVNTSGE